MMRKKPLRTQLVERALYLTPSGRVCQMLPYPRLGHYSDGLTAQFAYMADDGTRHSSEDGFNLLPALAERILRRVA